MQIKVENYINKTVKTFIRPIVFLTNSGDLAKPPCIFLMLIGIKREKNMFNHFYVCVPACVSGYPRKLKNGKP